ncbi:universal stress protein [Aestuariibacter sp. AA17]|uniref:Universal stress protein n=1 Tax=Fluctibacter corallii TaxID=2984329 RepID=A0ABT3A743_9ALTE|nr:universal stress protein [Aestuariibacter sp. AA17]MCV2884483.1 universal stress protein [Aestuariibacter sp. AA17]
MRSQNILYVFAGDESCHSDALARAVHLHQQGYGTLTCLCVYPTLRFPPHLKLSLPDATVIESELTERAKKHLFEAVEKIAPDTLVQCETRFGHMYIEAIRFGLQQQSTLIIKAAKNPEWTDFLFDSEDMHLLRKSPMPVWLTKEPDNKPIKHIVVALDFEHIEESEESERLNQQLLHQAFNIAQRERATLHLLNVYNASSADFASLWVENPKKLEEEVLKDEKLTRQAAMQDLIEEVEAQNGIRFADIKHHIHLIQGSPNRDIAKKVKALQADLVIMGSVGRSGIAGLLIGNTAETTLLQLECAVLVMKPDGFVSPIV